MTPGYYLVEFIDRTMVVYVEPRDSSDKNYPQWDDYKCTSLSGHSSFYEEDFLRSHSMLLGSLGEALYGV